MAANTSPIYSIAGEVQSAQALIRVAATVPQDGSGTIGTDVYKCFTSGADGGFVQRIRFKYAGTGTTASTACVIRVYVSSVTSGATTDANCWLWDELTIPTTGVISQTAGLTAFEIPLGFAIPASYTILAKVSVTQPANHGFIGTVVGGKY